LKTYFFPASLLFFRYDPINNEWELVADMTVKRSGAGVGVLG